MKSGRIRGPYRQACDICHRRRVKCDGDPGSVCPRCKNSGRGTLCSWDGYNARQKRGELLIVTETRKPADSKVFRELLLDYNKYANFLESELAKFSLKDVMDLRAHRPKDLDDLMGLSSSLADLHLDSTQEAKCVVGSDETESPTNIHLWSDKLALVYYGPCSPFRFRSDPLPVSSRFPAISENPDATYVLQVDGNGKRCSPHFDWSRHLPSAVALDRRSHDKALDLFFKFCTPFGLRLIPDLFLKDMNQALMVPRSQDPPKTTYYSPMLHNVLVALALAFLDDPKLQDLETRRHFIDSVKDVMEAECRRPTIAVVQALSLLGNFYGSQGEQGLGFITFGQSVRVAQALGLHLDCSELVLMDKSDQIDRNWATWSTFVIDVCWSLYVGREFSVVVPPDDFPLPYIDTALDEMPVAYGNLLPQPNHLTQTFHANAELFIIGRDILEVNNALSKTKARSSVVFDRVGDIGVKLQTWYSSLPSDLLQARSTAPHKLTLHLCYWWLVVLLHRPLFHHGASIKAGRQIDHVKICKRASDRIMEILKMWHESFGLRFCPVTIIQITFSAGIVYLLLAMRACSGVRIAKKELSHALEQQNLVTNYLQEISRSWPGANKVADILKNLVQQRLKPRLDAIPVRRIKTESNRGDDNHMDAQSPSGSSDSVRSGRRRSSSSKARPLSNRTGSRVSGQDSTFNNPPSGPQDASHSSQPVPVSTAPISISPTTYEPEHAKFNADPVYNGSNAEITNDTFFYDNIPFNYVPYQQHSIPPNQLFTYDVLSAHPHQLEGHVGQSNLHGVSSSWPPLYPNTGFLGVPEGQRIPELPSWTQMSMEDAQPNPAFASLLDEYLHASGDSSSTANVEDMDVSVDERDYWFGRLG